MKESCISVYVMLTLEISLSWDLILISQCVLRQAGGCLYKIPVGLSDLDLLTKWVEIVKLRTGRQDSQPDPDLHLSRF